MPYQGSGLVVENWESWLMGWKDWELLNWRNLKPAGPTRESIGFTAGKDIDRSIVVSRGLS